MLISSSTVHKLKEAISSSSEDIFCSGLYLSARWFVLSQVADKGVHFIILPTQEAAEYCSADLYNLIEGDKVFYLPASGKVVERSNYKGNETIFLDQFSKWGKALDFAYLYGSKNKKTFFGFQMKCYFENSELNDNAVDKCWIRKNCQKILVNSMKLFNCKITRWYYYLVFFLNNKNKSENINPKNIEKCRKNNIRFIFYEPFEKKFYDYKKKKLCIINELKLESKANLDAYVINEEKLYNLNLKGKIQIGKNMRQMQDSFFEDFKKVFKNQKELDTIPLILRKIAANIDNIFEVLDSKSEYYYWLLKWRNSRRKKSCSKRDNLNKNNFKMLNIL